MASWGTDNQARRPTARHDEPVPDPAGTSIASRTLRFTMLSGKLLEGVQGSVKVSVGLWHPGKKDYLEPPQQSKLMVDGCDFFMDGELRFTVVKAPDLGDCLLMIELSDKRLLRKHEVEPLGRFPGQLKCCVAAMVRVDEGRRTITRVRPFRKRHVQQPAGLRAVMPAAARGECAQPSCGCCGQLCVGARPCCCEGLGTSHCIREPFPTAQLCVGAALVNLVVRFVWRFVGCNRLRGLRSTSQIRSLVPSSACSEELWLCRLVNLRLSLRKRS